ncbi:hypothetical protein AAVH_22659 [Aphelenchoides avenae]|nr:hypothetical protein AAVH_22659 [Aphelenchus avenae]
MEALYIFNSVFGMYLRPHTQTDRFEDYAREEVVRYLRGITKDTLSNDGINEEMEAQLISALEFLYGTTEEETTHEYPSVFSSARSAALFCARRGLYGLTTRLDGYDENPKRRQLETKIHKVQRQLQNAVDRNESLERKLRSSEAARDIAVLKERERKAEVDRLMTLTEAHAQDKRQLELKQKTEEQLQHRVGQLAAQLAEIVGYKPRRKLVKGRF